MALVTLAGCATAPPPAPSPADRWMADLDAYRSGREKLAADLRQAGDDFEALVAEESFPGLEDKLATLASRLARSLWGLTLGAELESARLDRWLRRLSLAPVAESGAASGAARRIEFVSCR